MNPPATPKGRRVAFHLAIAIVCVAAVVSSEAAGDPTYDGKTLSEWLLQEWADRPPGVSADDALRHIGTNAIPLLLDLVGTTESNKGRVAGKFNRAAAKYQVPLRGMKAEEFRTMGEYAFSVLGTNAEAAVPKLTKLLHNDETCLEAAKALAEVGPAGFAVLTNAFRDENLVGVVVDALGTRGGGDKRVVTRLLISALSSPNWATRGNAAYALGGKDADLAVPALIHMLDDSEVYPKERAAIALSYFGPAARSAAPKLFDLYTNVIAGPDRDLARSLGTCLLAALRSVDREAAGQAEAFLLNNGPLGVAGYGWTTTRLPNGKELISGGSDQATIPTVTNRAFSRAELFDPATGSRTETGSMNLARYGHTATLLHDGRVLVAGGACFGPDGRVKDLTSAELYDPTTGKWTMTGSMKSPHRSGNAVLQRDGKVRVSDELYDPATGKWTATAHK